MKPINQIAILLALLIGCHGANKTPVTQPAEIIATQKEEIATQPAEIATQQEEPAKAPYIISTKEQLEDFSRMVSEGHDFRGEVVKLEANIMLNDTADWKNWGKKPPANSWVPIETKEKGFSGTFDGSGYVISGIYINSTNYDQGFFGYLDSSAEVKNLGIVASYIKGKEYVGGLVGFNDGTINNCYFSGIVTGVSDVGGLVGRNWSVIVNSHSNGTVTGAVNVGGLVGYFNDEEIINSYSTASVKGEGSVGGLVGMILDGIVSNSYSSGNVKGIYRTGGLIGYIGGPGSVLNSYSNGSVTGGKNGVGGMIGFNKREIYAVGVIQYESVIARSYYDKQTSNQSDQCKYAGKTTAEMKKKETYVNWDFENVWAINDTVNKGYPYLLGSDYIEKHDYMEKQKRNLSKIYIESTCPVESIAITTAKELADFARAVNSGKSFLNKTVMLGTNIMLNDTANWLNWDSKPPKNVWTPIGTRENRFAGTFNGNGFAISGVYINNSKDEQGLFGAIDIKGSVKNLGVVASYIKGRDKIGGITGINLGRIYGCYFNGIAMGFDDVGGIAGESVSYIKNSYSGGLVTGANNVGGIAGSTFKNKMSLCYSTSIVTGTKSNVGGLVGSSKSAWITESYFAGMAIGPDGLVEKMEQKDRDCNP